MSTTKTEVADKIDKTKVADKTDKATKGDMFAQLEELQATVKGLREEIKEHKSKVDNFSKYQMDLAEHGNDLEFQSNGFHCVMWRNHMRAWCAYVDVPNDHVLFGWHYSKLNDKRPWGDEDEEGVVDPLELIFDGVNMEFTYSKQMENGNWRFGWDYNQWNDYYPNMATGGLWGDASTKHYWDANEVKSHIEKVTKGFSLITKARLDKAAEEEED